MDIEGANLKGTKANIDPQKVKGKSLFKTNLSGLDLSKKDFSSVLIVNANLENTKANIDPQKIFDKSLYNTNVCGLKFDNVYFNNVNIIGTKFSKDIKIKKYPIRYILKMLIIEIKINISDLLFELF